MRGMTDPKGPDKKLAETLDKLLSGTLKEYIVISRTGTPDNASVGLYQLFGNLPEEARLVMFILNFLDGMLDDESFIRLAGVVSRRALERVGAVSARGEKNDAPN